MGDFIALSHFAPLLINGDGLDLSFKEGAQVDDFCERNEYTINDGFFDCRPDEERFAKCEITGLYGDCMPFKYFKSVA